MNGEDLKFLANRAETVRGRPDERLAEVHARIRSTRRRRAAEAAAATSAAVLALVIGIAVLTGPTGHDTNNGPLPPAHSGTPDEPTSTTIRKILYSDDIEPVVHDGPFPLSRVGIIHVGDREVEINQTLDSARSWSMFVTDAGAVYAQDDHSVWFTDGGEPRRIAAQTCADSSGDLESLGLATGNAGPWVAWFDCTPSSRGDLVIYDTGTGHEVARHPIPSCRAPDDAGGGFRCGPGAVIGEHVYFTRTGNDFRADHEFRLDVTSGHVLPASPKMYAQDVSSHPRGLVVGDAWQTGAATDGIGLNFRDVGTRLHSVWDLPNGEQVLTKSFDTATGHAVRLHLPAGYHADPNEDFTLFEWLDDDTVALVAQFGGNGPGDILTCHLTDGRCDLAVKAGPHNKRRIVAGGSLPG